MSASVGIRVLIPHQFPDHADSTARVKGVQPHAASIVSRAGAGRKEKEKRLKPSVFALLRCDKLKDRKAESVTFHFLG